MVVAVFLADVFQNFIPAVVGEIHINIGHGDSFGIQEPFKQQVIFDRIDVGDAREVGNEAAGRAAATRADHDALVLGPVDEILDDQKVRRIACLFDDVQFVFHALALLLGDFCIAESFDQAFFAQMTEITFIGEAFWHVEVGQLGFAQPDFHIAFVDNFLSIGDCFRHIGKMFGHFLRAFEIELKVHHVHAVRFADFAVGLDAEQNVLDAVVIFFDVVDVVSGDQRDAQFFGDFYQRVVGDLLVGELRMMLEFQIKIARSEYILIFQSQLFGLGQLAHDGVGRDLALGTGRKRNQAFRVFAQSRAVDPRLVIEAFQVGDRDQFHQIFVAFFVLGQQDQMVALAVETVRILAVQIVGCNVHLAADDRFDAALFGLDEKFDGAVQHAMVSDGQRFHPQLFGAVQNIVDLGETVE